jgi:hypothetical protein
MARFILTLMLLACTGCYDAMAVPVPGSGADADGGVEPCFSAYADETVAVLPEDDGTCPDHGVRTWSSVRRQWECCSGVGASCTATCSTNCPSCGNPRVVPDAFQPGVYGCCYGNCDRLIPDAGMDAVPPATSCDE